MPVKKLIEVALPLEEINKASAREKSIRHGHPSTLHLWWARRPLAAARAVIWASLVDDPSSHPEQFTTVEEQNAERERLFNILKKLIVWENSNNKEILDEAKAEILKSTGNNPPELLDPFAGGGSIPLEGQRLGLKVHAHDLNPVAVMINKAMIEIPPKFSGQPPINPESRKKIGGDTFRGGEGASGLAEDVKYYGERLKEEAFKKIGHLYPKIKTDEGDATVIAWIWARTVKCPNPACGCEMPLVNSFVLSKKKGHEAYIEPIIKDGKICYEVKIGKTSQEGTVTRTGAKCICCGTPVDFDYIRKEAQEQRMGERLIAIVAEGKKGRIYLSPTSEYEKIADVTKPENCPETDLPEKALGFRVQQYGMLKHKDLFTNRQLTMLTTFSDLISDIQNEIKNDAEIAGIDDEKALKYAQAVSVYLAFTIDKLAIFHVSLCPWNTVGEKIENCFGRQAIPMVWNFAEGNLFSNSSGCFDNMLEWIVKVILALPRKTKVGVSKFAAQYDCGLRDIMMISTDPPYYDNIGYADLSDYFYIWLRQSLKNIYPELFETILTPKEEELIATPYRHGGDKQKAKEFFEKGMSDVCKNLYLYAREDFPVTIYYAYKQSETEENELGFETASSGWETMLNAIIKAGFSITGTWPVRTERPTALKNNINALSSSIVLVCRKRKELNIITTRRDFIKELKRELRPALEKLQQSNIAPVDMPQSAIGPGIAVFSKYSQVLEADGKSMTVRSALQIINQELDSYFNEQDGEIDNETRFCVELYKQKGFDIIKFGDADNMARAKNISVQALVDKGLVYAQKGEVHLIDRDEIDINVSEKSNTDWLLTQKLTKAMEKGGIEACAKILAPVINSADRAKNLAYRLYNIAERKKWTQEAYAYNSLVTEWADIIKRARELQNISSEQLSLGLEI